MKILCSLFEFKRDKIQRSVIYFPNVFVRKEESTQFIRILSSKIIATNSTFENISKSIDERIINYDNPIVFQTDTQGLVTVLTDGTHIQVKSFLDKKAKLTN